MVKTKNDNESLISRFREALTYDSETGILEWTQHAPQRVRGKKVQNIAKEGYVRIGFERKFYKAHRVAWALYYGEFPNGLIDHINGIRADNRIANLRCVSYKLNAQNTKKPKNTNISGFLGVSKSGRGWRSKIHVNSKSICLGTYDTPEEAHEAYVEAKRKYHEGNTL